MRGRVYYQDKPIGTIAQTDAGYVFQYEATYVAQHQALPVSQTLPVQVEPYFSTTLFPFFDGLIPEGWLLDVAVETWKLNPRDRMKLLLTVCRDCVGAVSVIEENDE